MEIVGGFVQGRAGPKSRPPAPFPLPAAAESSKKVDQAVEAKLGAVSSQLNQVEISSKPEEETAKPKRYSTHRQQHQQQQPNSGSKGYSRPDEPFVERFAPPPTNGNASASTFVFPTSASGPPPSAPFLSVAAGHSSSPTVHPPSHEAQAAAQLAAAAVAAGTPPYGMYPGGAPQYGAVPVTVAPLMVGGPPGATPADLAVLAAAQPHLSSPEQLLLAAAAAGATVPPPQGAATNHQGYAEVRGGVTYFNPTAQPTVMSRPPVHKRPKAAIPIVDPSQVKASDMSPQNSVDEDHFDSMDNKNVNRVSDQPAIV